MKLQNFGFTLIEVIIYIALFSVLMGTALVTAYQIIDGSQDLSTKNTLQEEGNFVMRKFSWALTSVDTSASITPSAGSASALSLKKYDANNIDIRLNANKIEIKESDNGNVFLPITTANVSVTSLQFTYLEPSGVEPAGMTATAIINGATFAVTKYFR